MCTRYTTPRVETTVAESLINQLFNICEAAFLLNRETYDNENKCKLRFCAHWKGCQPQKASPPKKKKCEDAPSFQMAWERGPTLLCCVLSTSQLSSQDQDALGRIKIQNQNQATSSELIRKQTLHFNQRGQRARSKLLASRQLSW